MLSDKSIISLERPERAFILNLSHFTGGVEAAMQRIPRMTSGTYSWFRNFVYPNDPDLLFERLLNDLLSPKFQTRCGAIKPFYHVEISSKSWFSETKLQHLRAALFDGTFRMGLLSALSNSILFQAPLYVGKSKNVRGRIRHHLKSDSPLRLRLQDASINIDTASILIVPNPTVEDSDLSESAPFSEGEDEFDIDDQHESLYEEIFSRLFNPLFTIRLG